MDTYPRQVRHARTDINPTNLQALLRLKKKMPLRKCTETSTRSITRGSNATLKHRHCQLQYLSDDENHLQGHRGLFGEARQPARRAMNAT